jgi:hypothetical protein
VHCYTLALKAHMDLLMCVRRLSHLGRIRMDIIGSPIRSSGLLTMLHPQGIADQGYSFRILIRVTDTSDIHRQCVEGCPTGWSLCADAAVLRTVHACASWRSSVGWRVS